jgi:hypothetical protein
VLHSRLTTEHASAAVELEWRQVEHPAPGRVPPGERNPRVVREPPLTVPVDHNVGTTGAAGALQIGHPDARSGVSSGFAHGPNADVHDAHATAYVEFCHRPAL